MKATYIICEIVPTGEGADITFAGPGGARASHFYINSGSGLIELRLKVDLQEPKVLECIQEGAAFDLDGRVKRTLNTTKKRRQDVPGDFFTITGDGL